MAKDIKTQYNDYLNNTAPDMDMLWSRIESKIDNAENIDNTEKREAIVDIRNIVAEQNEGIDTIHEENRHKIKVSSFSMKKFAAFAAAFAVVIAGVTIMKNSAPMKKSENYAAYEKKDAAPEQAAQETVAGDDMADMAAEAEEGNGETDGFEDHAESTEAEGYELITGNDAEDTQEEAVLGNTDDRKKGVDDGVSYSGKIQSETSEINTDDDDAGGNALTAGIDPDLIDQIDGNIVIDKNRSLTYEEFTNLTTPDTDYRELELAESNTIGYQPNYEPFDSVELSEKEILADTEFFADVTVAQAELGSKEAEYKLTVNEWYSENEAPDIQEITIISSTPYILQENREYLVALKQSGDEWKLVYDNAPQIQITLDGGLIFSTSWYLLYAENGSNRFLYPDYELGNAVHQLMLYSDKSDINDLISQWKLQRLNSEFTEEEGEE